MDPWDPDKARDELRRALETTKGCVVEVIMKDVSTVRNEPQRLCAWAEMARDITDEFA